MKIMVFPERCEGHALCYLVDADLFPLDDDAHTAVVDGTEVPAGQEKLAREGVLACPVAALSVQE
jgi:ferredoxin